MTQVSPSSRTARPLLTQLQTHVRCPKHTSTFLHSLFPSSLNSFLFQVSLLTSTLYPELSLSPLRIPNPSVSSPTGTHDTPPKITRNPLYTYAYFSGEKTQSFCFILKGPMTLSSSKRIEMVCHLNQYYRYTILATLKHPPGWSPYLQSPSSPF